MYNDLQRGNKDETKKDIQKGNKGRTEKDVQKDEKDKTKKLSRTTVRYVHATLSRALNEALGKYLKTNILAGKKSAPKPKDYEAQFLTAEEVEELLKLFDGTDFYTPNLLAVGLGLRRGECLGLLWDCVNFETGTITVKRSYSPTEGEGITLAGLKTESSKRTLTVPDTIMSYLLKLKEKQKDDKKYFGNNYKKGDFVCCKSDGSAIPPHVWNKNFQRTLEKANFKHIRIHDLRHTNAALMILKNTPMKVVSQRLGHSSIKTTMDLYGHIYFEQQEEIAYKLNEILSFLHPVHSTVHDENKEPQE
jgi:integrase